MNGIPAPLAEDEDSDFGQESWYDRKDDKKGKTRGRRSRIRGGTRKSCAKNPVDSGDDRVADFNLLDHGFPSDQSDEESFFDSDHSEPRSCLYAAHNLFTFSRCRNADVCPGKTGST